MSTNWRPSGQISYQPLIFRGGLRIARRRPHLQLARWGETPILQHIQRKEDRNPGSPAYAFCGMLPQSCPILVPLAQGPYCRTTLFLAWQAHAISSCTATPRRQYGPITTHIYRRREEVDGRFANPEGQRPLPGLAKLQARASNQFSASHCWEI